MPLGQLPVLQIDNKRAYQSTAICRYLAKQAGIAGKDDWEAYQIDTVVDSITDFRLRMLLFLKRNRDLWGFTDYTAYFREKDEKLKAVKFEQCLKEHNPYYLSRLEKIVVENNGFFVNGKVWLFEIFIIINIFSSFRGLMSILRRLSSCWIKSQNRSCWIPTPGWKN